MNIIRKQRYMYTVLYYGKNYTFVTDKNIILFKDWFDKVHSAVCRYENIKSDKIPQSKHTGNYIKYLFI